MRTMRAPYTAVFRIFAGSRSAGMKTQASNPCCADCAATAFARFPVDEQPTVWNPICRTRGNLADKSPASAVQSRPGKHRRTGKTGHCKVTTPLRTNRELLFRADKEGNKKTLRAKECRRGLRISKNLYMLFSSFLRGASCPKSPRFAAASGSNINDRESADCQYCF